MLKLIKSLIQLLLLNLILLVDPEEFEEVDGIEDIRMLKVRAFVAEKVEFIVSLFMSLLSR